MSNAWRESAAVLVTGASTGIGWSCALHLDALGHRVFAGVRKEADAKKIEAAGSSKLTPVILDVTNAEQIAAASAQVEAELDGLRLGGVVNNAGVAVGGPMEFIELDALRQQLEINVIGQVAVTQAFLPLLRKGPGRIINIGSIGGKVASPLMGPYCASKFALEAITDAMRLELAPWGIWSCVVEPGQIVTPIWDKATDAMADAEARFGKEALGYYRGPIEAMAEKIKQGATKGAPPEDVAKAVEHALRANNPRTRYLVGKDARMGSMMRWLLPDKAFDKVIVKSGA